jgi:acyl-CoA synthetase (AMP-forming)/AMP-acid ligase II/thioesterase domain-containing protein/acyl carrier protein
MSSNQESSGAGKATDLRTGPQPVVMPLPESPKKLTTFAKSVAAGETITDIVRRHAQVQPDAPALVAEGQVPLTYAALAGLMDRIGEQLNAAGFGRGDRIAVVGPNDAFTAALITGIMDCAVAVPMNPELSVGEFVAYLLDLKVQALAVDTRMDTAARTAAQELDIPVIDVECVAGDVAGLVDIRPSGPTGLPRKVSLPTRPDNLALLLTTSGTTSHSKVVPITHGQLATKVGRMARAFELTPADRCLNLMPFFHAHALHTLGTIFHSGGSLITLTDFSVESFFRLLETAAPTWYTAGYTFHHTICAAASKFTAAIGKSRLRFIKTGSGHLDSKIANELEVFFRVPVIEVYSSTEAGRISGNPLPPAARKRGTVGRPFDGEVKVIDSNGQSVPPGQRGEVVIRSKDIFAGYENDPAANAESFVDGWFRTGDEGVFDEDGYLTLTGRIKDIINRGGEKITPSEVDSALKDHPDVIDAVTFPVPHVTLGQEVAAAVVPVAGSYVTDEVLTKFLRQRLASFKVPRRFVIVDEIPKGPTGKISRRGLAEQFGLVIDSAVTRPEPTGDDRAATPLEAKLQRIWAEVLRLDRVGFNEDFFMLGGDSLQAVELFLRIEKECGRRLPRAVLFEAGTVAKMAKHIDAGAPSSCIVPIQTKGDLPPFFCVHDGYGHVLSYRELSLLLGETQPFYGIQARGLDGEEEPFVHIDDMAAHYVKEIRKIQPEGPYYIGGHSMGGRVAYVMAQRLRAAGECVALLALFDTYSAYGQRKVHTSDWLARHLERIRSVPANRLPGYLWLRVANLAEMIHMRVRLKGYAAALKFCKSRGKSLPRFLRQVEPANDMIRREYRAQPYDGDATLFKAELYAWAHTDSHDGWKKLIRGTLDIRPIPGGHNDIMNQPHVRIVAAELADALEQARVAHIRPFPDSARAS